MGTAAPAPAVSARLGLRLDPGAKAAYERRVGVAAADGRTKMTNSTRNDGDAPIGSSAAGRPRDRTIATRFRDHWRRGLLRAVCDASGRVRPLFAAALAARIRRRLEIEHAFRCGGAAPICEAAADVVARVGDLDPALAGLEASLRDGRIAILDAARRDAATRVWDAAFAGLTCLPDRIAFVASATTEVAARDGVTLVVATDEPEAMSATSIGPDGGSVVFAHRAADLTLAHRADCVSWLIQALRPAEILDLGSRALAEVRATFGDALSMLDRPEIPAPADAPSAEDVDVGVVLIAHEEGAMAVASLTSVAEAVTVARRSGLSVDVLVVLDRPDAATVSAISDARPADWRTATVDFGDPGSSRNAGARLVHGRWIAHVDADDLCDPLWLVAAFRAAEAEPRLAVWHPETNVYFGGATHVWRHVDMEAPDFDPAVLVHTNCWTSCCFAPRALCLARPYPRSDLSRRLGYEDWAWNRDVIDHGAIHRIVPGTGHLVRVKTDGSVFRRSQARRCIPRATDLFRHAIAARHPSTFPRAGA